MEVGLKECWWGGAGGVFLGWSWRSVGGAGGLIAGVRWQSGRVVIEENRMKE